MHGKIDARRCSHVSSACSNRRQASRIYPKLMSFFNDDDKYIFLGGLLKALGSDGARIIQESISVSDGQLDEAEKLLNELHKNG